MTSIYPPTDADRDRIAKMWLKACEIVQECCSQTLDQSLADLDLLQRVIDCEYLTPSQTWELQCLGIALEEGKDVNVRALYDFALRTVAEKGGSVDRAAT
jgi:hypothetical protein